MKLPIIIINFKCYEQATGKKAIELAKICQSVSKKYRVNIAVAPQFTDIAKVAEKVKIPVFAQHIDFIQPGAFTGHITALAVKEAGAVGTLINHSEKKLPLEAVGKCMELARQYKLTNICCADGMMASKDIARFGPDFLAYEPPELIGTGTSVSKCRPEIVEKIVELVKRINPKIKVLCGAGVVCGDDVKKAIELGTCGILVASGVVKARYPEKILTEFAKAIK